MKRILYLSFYFEPDLCAGSFRNTPLAKELAKQLKGIAEVDVYTTMPNRYQSFQQTAPEFEKNENLSVHRIAISHHQSGLLDQIKSFKTYYFEVKRKIRSTEYDMVFASSSRLFTAFLGSSIARSRKIPFYADVRDIFYDGIKDLMSSGYINWFLLPVLKKVEERTFSYASHINLISGGFTDYFRVYHKAAITSFTNGIDDEFIGLDKSAPIEKERKVILYAGNIGEGQGLHKFIPFIAKPFENTYDFIVIGDGGARVKLEEKIKELNCTNIRLEKPVGRSKLIEAYEQADFFLMHLNDFEAFKKVLPSKIFELGSMDKPIIAGVGGYAAEFVKENVPNTILVKPCDYESCIEKLKNYQYVRMERKDFVKRYKRSEINVNMAKSIKSYL